MNGSNDGMIQAIMAALKPQGAAPVGAPAAPGMPNMPNMQGGLMGTIAAAMKGQPTGGVARSMMGGPALLNGVPAAPGLLSQMGLMGGPAAPTPAPVNPNAPGMLSGLY